MWWPTKRREADLDTELRTHLEMAEADRIERGESPAAAAAAVRREFGNVALVQEATRHTWGGAWLRVLAQDLRFGWRLLVSTPGMTAVAVISLALGVGANTAIFSVMDALVWRPLPVSDPDRLVEFQAGLPGSSWAAAEWDGTQFPYPTFERYRDTVHLFDGIAAIIDADRSSPLIAGVSDTMEPGAVHVALASGTYFDVFRVKSTAGRLFGADDDRVPGAHPIAVISERFWTRRLNRASDVVGRVLTLGNSQYSIVGVVTGPFTGDYVTSPTDIWIPIMMAGQLFADRPNNPLTNATGDWARIVARLPPGVTADAAGAAVNAVYLANRGTLTRDPRMTAKEFEDQVNARILLRSLARGFSPERAHLTPSLTVVAGIVGLLLLLACSNVANLLLARGSSRENEMAVRRAIGAGTGRLVRQLLTEAVLLAMIGGALGCLFALLGASWLATTFGSGLNGPSLDVHADWRVFITLLGLSIGSAILFGLGPAITSARGGRSLAAGPAARTTTRRRFTTSRVLIVIQIAISMVLAIAALLFVRTLHNLRVTALDDERARVLVAWVPASEQGHRGPQVAALFQSALDRAAAIPGVVSVSASTSSFFGSGGGVVGSRVVIPGRVRADDESDVVRWNLITPGFFDTVGIKRVHGRDFDARDVIGAPRVAIVNESMARTYFETSAAIGQHFGMRREAGDEIEIVGVVADAPVDSPTSARKPMIYLPFRQESNRIGEMALFVKASGDSAALAESIRAALRNLDPSLPIRNVSTLGDVLDRSLVQNRVVAGLASTFGAIAALLTSIGLYGLMAYVTARRTREIGVRLALGATPRTIMTMTFREALVIAVIGVLLGVPLVLGAGRLVEAQFFGVSATDPILLIAVGVAMTGVSILATAGPALRATRIDPTTALRLDA